MKPISEWTAAELEDSGRNGWERRLTDEVLRLRGELAESQHGYALQITTVANGVRANRALLARAEAAEAAAIQAREDWEYMRRQKEAAEAELAEVSRNRDTSAARAEADLARERQAEALSDYHRKITECNAAEAELAATREQLVFQTERANEWRDADRKKRDELARCRPVVDAAVTYASSPIEDIAAWDDQYDRLEDAVDAYRAGEPQ